MTTPARAPRFVTFLVCECCLVLVPPAYGPRCGRCLHHESRGFTCSSKAPPDGNMTHILKTDDIYTIQPDGKAPPTKEGRGKESAK